MNIAIVSLGCPKNQVDADIFCRALVEAGHRTVPALEEADAVIINTCGFIESAKEEAIGQILEACELKKALPRLKVIVTGCLAERYKAEVAAEIPEVDAVVGLGQNAALPEILARLAEEGRPGGAPLECYGPKAALPLGAPRVISTPGHYAWLKIAEGCSNRCAYCAIPAIRGPLRSRPMASVLAEAEWLAEQGVKELVLVAQDVTAYGDDLGENQIVPLLKELDRIEGFGWIRLLYAYPERVTPELLDAMAQSQKVLPYLDLPVQHCDEGILRAMGRRAPAARRALALVRERLPGATLRSTLIAGLPGEGEAEFEALCAFVTETRFDRLGCFAYSPEEGTRAAAMPGQVPEEERLRRAEVIMRIQSEIMAEKQAAKCGQSLRVLCDGYDGDEGLWMCRAASDAPEIDTGVLVRAMAPMRAGEFYEVRVTHSDGADLYADYEGKDSSLR